MKAQTLPKMKDGWRQNCQCDDTPQRWVKKKIPDEIPESSTTDVSFDRSAAECI